MIESFWIESSEAARSKFFETVEWRAYTSFSSELTSDVWILSIVEAVNNAAEHGNREVPDQPILVEHFYGKRVAICSVEDCGPGFEPSFPALKSIQGSRGRGLSMIKASVDIVYHNTKGNKITMIKGEETMRFENDDIRACVLQLDENNIIASDIILHNGKLRVPHGVGALVEHMIRTGARHIWLDISGINLFTSTTWGGLLADAEEEGVQSIILLNASPGLHQTAKLMELGKGNGPAAKIRVFGPDEKEGTHLLAKYLTDAND